MTITDLKKLAFASFLALGLLFNNSTIAQDADSKQNPKSQQVESEQEDSDNAKQDKSKSDDEKESDDATSKDQRPEKQLRTGTKRLGRLLGIARNSNEMVSTFEPVAASASQSTVVVLSGKKQIALGTIVGTDGFILTKASQLDDKLSIWAAGRKYDATVFGIHKKSDLAMLKIEAENLATANFSQSPAPITGSWLACPGPDEEPFALGTVGVNVRKISSSKAFVGIQSRDTEDKNGVKITSVVPDSPADKADLWVNDIIIKIADNPIKEFMDLRNTLAKFEPGDRVELTIIRGDKEIELALELADAGNFNSDFERSNQQNRMGSLLSKRRQDFPLAFQHDCGLNANQCGGPIVDLSGQVVGINIARAERVSSLAIPSEAIQPVIDLLMSGEYSPAVINKQRLVEVDRKIARINSDLLALPSEQEKLSQEKAIEDARLEELERMKTDIQADFDRMMKELQEELDTTMKQVQDRVDLLSKEGKVRDAKLDSIKKKIYTYKRKIKQLESSKEDLIKGVEN